VIRFQTLNEYLDHVLIKVEEENIRPYEVMAIKATIRGLSINRDIDWLYRLLKLLNQMKLYHLLPSRYEIEEWIKRKEIKVRI